METGMLWYDDDKQCTLEDKVRKAAEYYRQKYGRNPTLCLVNPKLAVVTRPGNGSSLKQIDAVELRTAQNILLHHFWIGVARNGNGRPK